MYNKMLFFIILLLSIALVTNAQETCPKDKTDAINEYMMVNSIDDLMDQMLVEVLKKIPKENHDIYKTIWKSSVDKIEMKRVMLSTICKNFSIGEIKALTQFYGSPEGKSVMKKMPQYTAELMPYYIAVTQRAMQKLIEELEKREKENRLDRKQL
jgi:uncharacterized protein